jgi:hypothetical protein
MFKSTSSLTRFFILLLFSAALIGLVGHQLLLAPDIRVPTAGAFLCTQDNRSGQEASPDTAGCPVHTGYLVPTMTAIRFSPPITWGEECLDLTSPFLLAIPVPHPPA